MNKRIAKKITRFTFHDRYSRPQVERARKICWRGSGMDHTLQLVHKLTRLKEEATAAGQARPTDLEVETLILGWREKVRPRVWREVKGELRKICSFTGEPYGSIEHGVAVSARSRAERKAGLERGDPYASDLYDHIVGDLFYYSDRWCVWRVARVDEDVLLLEAGER